MIAWSDRFSVYNSGIDGQHKVLFEIMNELAELLKAEDYSFQSIYEVIVKLDNYIREHFSYEEMLMTKNEYPEMEAHVFEHDKLRERIENINVFNIAGHKEFYDETLTYLVEWLSTHIVQTDKKLGEFLMLAV